MFSGRNKNANSIILFIIAVVILIPNATLACEALDKLIGDYKWESDYGIITKYYYEGIPKEFKYMDPYRKHIVKIGFSGRPLDHIVRLLDPDRTDIENEFGKAYINQWPQFFHRIGGRDNPERKIARGILGGEGRDVAIWWSVAPYLYRHLRDNGDSEENAVFKIVRWASKSKGRERDISKVGLPGLKAVGSDPYRAFILNPDSKHKSHKLADDLALALIKERIVN